MIKHPLSVEIVDVTLRDGLQLLTAPVPLESKLRLLAQLQDAGVRRLELGSFVNPKLLPQFSDTPALMMAARSSKGLRGAVLIPNRRGFELASPHRPEEIIYVISASEAHNEANVRRSIDASLAEFLPLLADAAQAGVHVRLAVATAFHCPFAGPTPHAAVFRLLDAAVEAGLKEAVLADTIGHAHPHEVDELMSVAAERYRSLLLGIHAHDTLGRGVANVKAAVMAGAGVVDAALGGLGGCPYAPGSAGNVSTEAVAAALHKLGVTTGLDEGHLALAAQTAMGFGAPARVPPLSRDAGEQPIASPEWR